MTRRYEPGMEGQRRRWAEQDAVRRSEALLDVAPTPDIAVLETAAESLVRFGDMSNVIALFAIALRLRMEVEK